VRFIVFDLLHIEGRDLTGAPLGERRRLLEQLLHAPPAALALSPTSVGAAPEQLLAIAAGHGLEGLVCKRAASLYQLGRRTRAWIKTVLARSTEVTVIGCVRGRARHADGVGALLVAVPDEDGRLRYAGQVETGWTRDEHAELVVLGQDVGDGRRGELNEGRPFGRGGDAQASRAATKGLPLCTLTPV